MLSLFSDSFYVCPSLAFPLLPLMFSSLSSPPPCPYINIRVVAKETFLQSILRGGKCCGILTHSEASHGNLSIQAAKSWPICNMAWHPESCPFFSLFGGGQPTFACVPGAPQVPGPCLDVPFINSYDEILVFWITVRVFAFNCGNCSVWSYF